MVRVELPDAEPEATDTFNLLLFPAVTLVGEKLAVTPVGSPLTESATGELNPLKLLTLRTNAVELPISTLAAAGVGTRVKVPAATVTVSESVRVNPPPV